MNLTGNSIGKTYLGVPRMHPIAGSNHSLSKIIREELNDLYGGGGGSGSGVWDIKIHPWIFCSFDKTLTAMWHANHKRYGWRLKYRWRGIIPNKWQDDDPRFFINLPKTIIDLLVLIKNIRQMRERSFVERKMGFFNAIPWSFASSAGTTGSSSIVLDSICIRAYVADIISEFVIRDLKKYTDLATFHHKHGNRKASLAAEAKIRRLQELDFILQLWTDQMLDLAYWMQQNKKQKQAGYRDSKSLQKNASLLLYPHGRRFVSIYDLPDLVPWLPYTSACQERDYLAPKSSASLMAAMASGGRNGRSPSGSSRGGGSNMHGMASLVHMVLSKSNPHPCKIRNLDQIAVRNAITDPPVGLATMDMVHIFLMGNMPNCRVRPKFSVRSRIRVQSLAFRGATAVETSNWIRKHYRLLHLAFKEWYTQTVRWSPAYEAVIADVQHHAEYVECSRRAADEIRGTIDISGSISSIVAKAITISGGGGKDCIHMVSARVLDDSAHMCHGQSLKTLGKLRKGSFVTTSNDRMRGWLRALCAGKENMSQQYREELTQMMVLSKIFYSQPEYGLKIMKDIKKAQESMENTTPPMTKEVIGIDKWALGVPLTPLPLTVISSFLKWEGDSALSVGPWFVDSSFFISEPYAFLDMDTLLAIDLAAWMTARRTDGRFITSWLRFPIGLSEKAYNRLRTLYFSYEFCDVADNSFLIQLRRFLFRRRRRVIPRKEYEARKKKKDPSLIDSLTEQIVSVNEDYTSGKVVAYRIVEEYGTKESRRDLAIIYEYINRIVTYKNWSVIPLGTEITKFQIEAVKRRQTIEPWRRTSISVLGSHLMCACGRWCCQAVGPVHKPITTSVTERQRTPSAISGMDKVIRQIHLKTEPELLLLQTKYKKEKQILETSFDSSSSSDGSLNSQILDNQDLNGPSGANESLLNSTQNLRILKFRRDSKALEWKYEKMYKNLIDLASDSISYIESHQPILFNVVPTRRVSKIHPSETRSSCASSMAAAAAAKHNVTMSAVAKMDALDVRLCVGSSRWSKFDIIQGRHHAHPDPDPDREEGLNKNLKTTTTTTKLPPINRQLNSNSFKRYKKYSSSRRRQNQITLPLLSASEEPVSRDIHPSTSSYISADSFVRCNLESNQLTSKEKNRAPYCKGRLFRINLLGSAVRPKGPKAPTDGPWYTICATCGAMTTLDLGRWNHRGPTCGAHGRPHRLPDRFALFNDRIEGHELKVMLGITTSSSSGGGGGGSGLLLNGMKHIAKKLRLDLSALDASAGLPCPEEEPYCWYCGQLAVTPKKHTKTRFNHGTQANNGDNSIIRNENLKYNSTQQQQQQPEYHQRQQQQQQQQQSDIEQTRCMYSKVRYKVGTSVATATIGSAGGALYARQITRNSTDQTVSVRRINIRGSMFGRLAGLSGGSLISEQVTGCHHLKPNIHLCVSGRCNCNTKLKTMKHGISISAPILPVELLPVASDEICLKVLDDISNTKGKMMRLRWIYLCPTHMKDVRVGWVANNAKLIQIDAAKGRGISMVLDEMTCRAARNGHLVGKQVILCHLFSSLPLLSIILKAIKRGNKIRAHKHQRFGTSLSGVHHIPDYSQNRRNTRY